MSAIDRFVCFRSLLVSLMLSAHSKKVLQSKLNQPRRHRGPSDDAEVCGPKVGSGIGELRMVQSVVELHAESELCIFAKAADCSGFAEREIGIELSRAVHDALTGASVTGRSVRPDGRGFADCRFVNPVVQTIRGPARCRQIFVCRSWAKCNRRSSGETVD